MFVSFYFTTYLNILSCLSVCVKYLAALSKVARTCLNILQLKALIIGVIVLCYGGVCLGGVRGEDVVRVS